MVGKPRSEELACEIVFGGRVQSVGFRPLVYRLALQSGLKGWIQNRVGQVVVRLQGDRQSIDRFVDQILAHRSLAKPKLIERRAVDPAEFTGFDILHSSQCGKVDVSVPADMAPCDACLSELEDLSDRRFHYPFINCTECGPRYTLIRTMPYDRPNTTLSAFELCTACQSEYQDVRDRRFHAEPVACPDCGPSLFFKDNNKNKILQTTLAALDAACECIRSGGIVAVKGVGGYHLICDATCEATVRRLRLRKARPHKPLAIMLPFLRGEASDLIAASRRYVDLTSADASFLLTIERPLLLVGKSRDSQLCASIAPQLSEVGVMLPYSPLHHLLLQHLPMPLVATSANVSGDPVLIEDVEVEQRLHKVADAFLHHNRPIARPADDPVFRNLVGSPRPLRLGRGISPLEIELPYKLNRSVLAVGAHMKNTIALAWDDRVVVSPHVGELSNLRSLKVFEQTIEDFQSLYGVSAEHIVCDAHPAYASTRWARTQGLPVTSVLHHHAHASATWFEMAAEEDVMVFSWDGVGLGDDNSLWGGELFVGHPGSWRHAATLKPFYLPGGDKAGREPWRSAAAVCWEANLHYLHDRDHELAYQAWSRKLNCPGTSSVGRLFDAAAALTEICTQATYEGQAAMQLEACCGQIGDEAYPVRLPTACDERGLLVSDWRPLLAVLRDQSMSAELRAGVFHLSMAQLMVDQACAVRRSSGASRVGFSGGVFQNRLLTEMGSTMLEQAGFDVTLPTRVPVNDAGISFGQIIEYQHLNH